MPEIFLKHLQFEKRYSSHTVEAYEEDLRQFHGFLQATFEITEPEEVKHIHIRSWVVQLMEDGNQPRSVNRKIACLKSYYKFLLRREYITQNPATRIKPLKTEKPLPAFVKETDMGRLLDDIPFTDDLTGLRDRLIVELFYGTGMRLSELIGLKSNNVNIHSQTLKVLGKRNKERVIPIGNSLVNTIKIYQKAKTDMGGENGNEWLLTTDRGEQLYPMLVQRTIKHYLGLVTTLTKKSPHVLRHTYATHLLNHGADLNAVKDLLGHTSLAATQVYTHNTIEKLKKAFDQAHPKA